MNKNLKIAAVLPRYGESLGGGAETLTKSLVENALQKLEIIEQVEIWTTCALDHRTWKNELKPGLSREGGLSVHRFPVAERDLAVFLQAERSIHDGIRIGVEEQLDWMANSVNSHGLYRHIESEADQFDYILFAPYLFATSFWGSLIRPEKSILIPCLHDEPYAYQPIFKALFSRVAGIIFNTNAERELAQQIYGLDNLEQRSAVVGMGFNPPDNTTVSTCLSGSNSDLDLASPYLLYSGRKEQGKNLDLLIKYYSTWRQTNPENICPLVLIGAGEINFLDSLPEGVIDLGFVTEEDKSLLFSRATLLCQPSVNESFSIVMMEAWQHSCPVLVHAQCSVTREHVVESSGGLYFANQNEFSAILNNILIDPTLSTNFGENGKLYVEEEYSWSAVLERFEEAIYKISSFDSSPDKMRSAGAKW